MSQLLAAALARRGGAETSVVLQIKTAGSGSGAAGSPQSGPPQKQFPRQLLMRIAKKKRLDLRLTAENRFLGQDTTQEGRKMLRRRSGQERKEAAANKGDEKLKNWRVETLSRTSSSSSSMLVHANEKQLRGLMRLGCAVQSGAEEGNLCRPRSLTLTHHHTAAKKQRRSQERVMERSNLFPFNLHPHPSQIKKEIEKRGD